MGQVIKLFAIITTLSLWLVPAAWSHDTLVIIDRLDHGDFFEFITIAYSYDDHRGVACVSATATRYPDGAATVNKCYGSPIEPAFWAETYGFIAHSIENPVTTFKVYDETNGFVCYGTLVTRSSYSGYAIVSSNASISMDCL